MADFWDSTTFVDPTQVPGSPAEANMGLQTSFGTTYINIDNDQVKIVVQLDDYGMDNQVVKISEFPFTYLSTLKDSVHTMAQGTPDDFGFGGAPYDSVRITVDIITTSLVDGWGSLKIGNETYDSVLRVRNETFVDVTPEGKLFGTWTPVPLNFDQVQKVYAWYGRDGKYSLAEAVMDSAGTSVTMFSYQSPVFHPQVGLSTVSQNVIKTSYPNPVNDMLAVELKSESNKNLQMQVIDITGKVVLSKTIDAISGTTRTTIDTRELPEGMYIARFNGANTNGTTKFVVKH
jgi:hypothetical protein